MIYPGCHISKMAGTRKNGREKGLENRATGNRTSAAASRSAVVLAKVLFLIVTKETLSLAEGAFHSR